MWPYIYRWQKCVLLWAFASIAILLTILLYPTTRDFKYSVSNNVRTKNHVTEGPVIVNYFESSISYYPENTWILVVPNELYVYSAHFDARPILITPSKVTDDPSSSNFVGLKLVAITRRRGLFKKSFTFTWLFQLPLGAHARILTSSSLKCRVRMSDRTTVIVHAIIEELPEHHSFPYTSSIVYCPLKDLLNDPSIHNEPLLLTKRILKRVPIAVEVFDQNLASGQIISLDKNFRVNIPNSQLTTSPPSANNIVAVIRKLTLSAVPKASPNGPGRIALCVPPLFSSKANPNAIRAQLLTLVQFIEWHGLLGVDEITFYLTYSNTSSPYSAITSLLNHYARRNSSIGNPAILLNEWILPTELRENIHYNGQVASIQDCMFARGNGLVDVLMFQDIDELFIPHNNYRSSPLSLRDLFGQLAAFPIADYPTSYSRYPICGFSFLSAYYGPPLSFNSPQFHETSNRVSKGICPPDMMKMSGATPSVLIPAIEWTLTVGSPFPHTIRSKVAVLNPSRLTSMGIHEVLRYPSGNSPSCTILQVDTEVAYIKHFSHLSSTYASAFWMYRRPIDRTLNMSSTQFRHAGIFALSGLEEILYRRIWVVLHTLATNNDTSRYINELFCQP